VLLARLRAFVVGIGLAMQPRSDELLADLLMELKNVCGPILRIYAGQRGGYTVHIIAGRVGQRAKRLAYANPPPFPSPPRDGQSTLNRRTWSTNTPVPLVPFPKRHQATDSRIIKRSRHNVVSSSCFSQPLHCPVT